MNWLFLVFIILTPFSPIFFRRIDLWYAAGQYFQLGILFLLSYWLFDKQKKIEIKNIPLALTTLYFGLTVSFVWYQTLAHGQLAWIVFQPFFNWLCFLLFYKMSFQLNKKGIERIVTFLSYSLCVYLFVCVLQYFDHYPYFKVFAYLDNLALHRVVGFIGNETQNATYLAMCLPIFYFKKNRFSILCACLIWAIIGITGSATAVIVGLTVTVFFSVFYRLPVWYYLFIVLGGVGFVLTHDLRTYFNASGRLDVWIRLMPLIKESSIFGKGLGTMNLIAKRADFLGWRHAHNEYIQLWFEVGIFGALAVIYCVYEYFIKFLKDRLSICLASCFLGFCVAGLCYYPGHLFIPAMIGMMAYSFMYVLKNEEMIENAEYTFRTEE